MLFSNANGARLTLLEFVQALATVVFCGYFRAFIFVARQRYASHCRECSRLMALEYVQPQSPVAICGYTGVLVII